MKQIVFFSFLLIAFLLPIQSIFAATGDIEGWAWGGGVTMNPSGYEGVGWISMNSKNCDVDGNGLIDNVNCGVIGNPTALYAVNIPTSDGNLSGYAWSEHYGWISFNAADVTGCPNGACIAQRVGDNITGWARILSIRDAGLNAGGWQGFVSLSGVGYGLQISKMDKTGTTPTYAYSDELGWIDFSRAGYSADYRICPTSLTITEGMTGPLHAYYNANGLVDCMNTIGATDVTNLVVWSSSAPARATVGVNTGLVTGITTGNSAITTSNYGGKIAPSVTVNVICASDYAALCAAQSRSYCPTETQPITDRCGITTNTCTGTRNCNYNWKEIAP